MSPTVNSHLNPEEASDRISSQLAKLPPKRGIIYVDGPSGAGKTALLADFAASTTGAVLVDATGRSAEEVADQVMRAIGVSYGDFRSIHALTSLVDDLVFDRKFDPRIVVVTNTQWAGKRRFTDEPLGVAAGGIVGAFSRRSKETNIKLVVEVDSEVYDLSPRNQNPIPHHLIRHLYRGAARSINEH
ncbi:ATP-binding protein, partial [Streptomyces sp. uw30]|uniref:ATP-binding protein n=1 Tax=Streptomyces sp. uw30 TaxID=1828179 RepID=UPI001C9BFCEA